MDLPRKETSVDPLGHALIQERIQSGIGHTEEILTSKQGSGQLRKRPQTWVITGTGSSEAHARFLAWLINHHTTHHACFCPLSYFASNIHPHNAGLIVISQGLSPNATLALHHRESFEACILFTATTQENKQKGELIKELLHDGASIIPFLPEDEYTTLLRVAGPLTGYAACIHWAQSTLDATIKTISIDNLKLALNDAYKQGKALATPQVLSLLKQGCFFLTHAPFSEYLHNLSYKIMEGLFLPQPPIWDIGAFSHGPFQELSNNPRLGFIIQNADTNYDHPFQLAKTLLEQCTPSYHTLRATLPDPWSILECEMTLNGLIETALNAWNINQVNWPGQGKDTALYTWSHP